jgi:acyl-homoserine lactone acylase PvdQ
VRRWLRRLLWTLGGLAVILGGLALWVFWPESAAGEVEGLDAAADRYDVQIVRDEFGVPFILGPRNVDVAYGLAFAHAEDDFLTIQQSALAARGKLATIYGKDAAPNDYLVGLLRVWETVEERYETDLSPEVRAICEAYADGVNHYAALHPDEALKGLFPLTGRDIVAGSVHKSPLFFGLEETLIELFDDEPASEVSPRFGAYGSNVMAVAPSRSENGSTLFLSNSHQPWDGPVAWYEANVHSDEGWHFSGALFPGMPVFALGTNGHLAWSFTVNHPDLVDVFRLEVDPDDEGRYRFEGEWREFETWDVPIRVRIAGRFRWTVTREALWTPYGPAIRRPHGTYAVRYAGMGLAGIYEQLFRMGNAETFEEWSAPLGDQSGLPTFNVGYADRTGRIFYGYHALVPIRDEHYDWSQYLPGDTAETLWTDYLPFEALPRVLDPAAGFVQNANSTPWQTTGTGDDPDPGGWSATLGIEDWPTNRSLRALELLGSDSAISMDELLDYKHDLRYHPDSDVARWRDLLVVSIDPDGVSERHGVDVEDVRAALDTLRAWDLSAGFDARGIALMVGALSWVFEETDDDDRIEFDPSQLAHSEVPFDVLEEAFAESVEWLIDGHGRVDPAWAEVNRLRRGDVDLAVEGAPDVLRAVYGERERDGTFTGIAGDAYILAVEWDAAGAMTAFSVHQYGSATLDEDSPHYADQAPLFADERFRPVWFEPAEILEHAVAVYRPGENPAD